jgi:hypothetical protein
VIVPKSADDMIRHADALERRFLHFDPHRARTLDPHESALMRAAIERAAAEAAVIGAVRDARRAGLPWRRIGAALGITAQAAHRRFGGRRKRRR